MTSASPAIFHKLYGSQKPRVVYYKRDLIDYAVMIVVSGIVLAITYGVGRPISIVGLVLCSFMLAMFTVKLSQIVEACGQVGMICLLPDCHCPLIERFCLTIPALIVVK